MKERSIIFSAPMVRAILEGRKTQTRRIVKPQPVGGDSIIPHNSGWQVGGLRDSENAWRELSCPYGRPGDKLWVRETWGTVSMQCLTSLRQVEQHIIYRAGRHVFASENAPADYDFKKWPVTWANDETSDRWRPSIHMPREHSRITLEITGVRVERLHEISAKDILAEGAVARGHDDQFGHNPVSAFDGKVYLDLKSLWAAGWDKINAKRAPWQSNPWVWAIEFKRV